MFQTSLARRLRDALAVGTVLGACLLAAPAQASPSGGHRLPDVFTATNDAAGNEVVAYRSFFGQLHELGRFPTGGAGSGAGLGNQSALELGRFGRHLLVVNAGSDTVSHFLVLPHGLHLLDVEPSGGTQPISVTMHGNLVYVLNAGGDGNIAGFRVLWNGDLVPILGATRPLSAAAPGPAQVSFDPRGDWLVVSEKGTSRLVTYRVHADGTPGMPVANASEGVTPFGFDFDDSGLLLVSEATMGMPGASTVSSYRIRYDGTLFPLMSAFPTGQTAACWLVTTPLRPYAYTTNTGSDNLSGLFDWAGHLSLLDDDGDIAPAGDAPIDAAFGGRFGSYLYVLNGADATIGSYYVDYFGTPWPLGTVGGLPAGTNGLAAH